MTRWMGIVIATALAALLTPGVTKADSDELMPCKILVIKAAPAAGGQGLTKFVCKPPPGGAFALPSAEAAPTGSFLGVSVNTVPPGNSSFYPTACTGLGNPAGSKGYKCRFLPNFPAVLVKTNVVKGVAKLDIPQAFGVAQPFAADLAIRLVSEGTDTKNYCARFPLASALRNDASEFIARDAPAPVECSPSGAFL
jgi:hypothetical protein